MIIEEEEDYEDPIRLTGLDHCIIGVDSRGYFVYDYGKLQHHFVVSDGMGEDEAMEWIDYNILGICPQNFVVLFDDFDLDLDDYE